eukprot:scaffold47562_cov61-Cyclotella_meneghiniana.AAC.1
MEAAADDSDEAEFLRKVQLALAPLEDINDIGNDDSSISLDEAKEAEHQFRGNDWSAPLYETETMSDSNGNAMRDVNYEMNIMGGELEKKKKADAPLYETETPVIKCSAMMKASDGRGVIGEEFEKMTKYYYDTTKASMADVYEQGGQLGREAYPNLIEGGNKPDLTVTNGLTGGRQVSQWMKANSSIEGTKTEHAIQAASKVYGCTNREQEPQQHESFTMRKRNLESLRKLCAAQEAKLYQKLALVLGKTEDQIRTWNLDYLMKWCAAQEAKGKTEDQIRTTLFNEGSYARKRMTLPAASTVDGCRDGRREPQLRNNEYKAHQYPTNEGKRDLASRTRQTEWRSSPWTSLYNKASEPKPSTTGGHSERGYDKYHQAYSYPKKDAKHRTTTIFKKPLPKLKSSNTMTSYNLYYILERELFLKNNGVHPAVKITSSSERMHYGDLASKFPPLPSRRRIRQRICYKRFSDSTLVSLHGLTSAIAKSWKSCDTDVKEYVTAVAKIIMIRYKEITHSMNSTTSLASNLPSESSLLDTSSKFKPKAQGQGVSFKSEHVPHVVNDVLMQQQQLAKLYCTSPSFYQQQMLDYVKTAMDNAELTELNRIKERGRDRYIDILTIVVANLHGSLFVNKNKVPRGRYFRLDVMDLKVPDSRFHCHHGMLDGVCRHCESNI